MQRSFLSRTIICLLPTLIAAAVVVRAYVKDPENLSGFKLGNDLRGGTILVYEVDQDASKQSSGRGADSGRVKADTTLADSLKKRIDPADLLGIVIRPLGDSRVEIILPYGGRGGSSGVNQNEVEKIKGLIREVGSLEFRILANLIDDQAAIADVTAYFDKAAANPDSEEAKALEAAARAGLPPPFPNKAPGDADEYLIAAADQTGTPVQYAWVELGKNQRADLGLSSVNPGPGRDGVELAPVFQQYASLNRKVVNYGRNVYHRRESKNDKDPEESAKKKYDYFVLTRVSDRDRLLVGGDVSITAFVDQDEKGSPSIGFAFNSRGASRFFEMTNRNRPSGPESSPVSRDLGIILDGYLISHASIKTAIRERGHITGNFERAYVERIVTLLRSGALPATLKPRPVSENTIGPTLGKDTIDSGRISILLAFATVLIFMMIYYRFAGIVATIALFANLLLTVGFMVAVNATFTLPGLAGLVLMLGMAVDANVLIYERVREERDRGMNLPTALRNGYDRALPTIIDTHLSSIFTAIVLYTVGNDQLKGFGISLTVGLIISLFTSLFMTRLIFDFWQSKNWLTKLRMLRFFSRPNINFMGIRYAMFAATGISSVLGIGIFLARGQQGLNVDFVGGTAYSGRLVEPVEIAELRKILSEENQHTRLKVSEVTEIVDPSGKTKHTYEITYEQGGQKSIVTLANAPEGNGAGERAANVKERASILKDLSVEQIFPGGSVSNKSPLFTIRTTEREREIVESSISRLFKNDKGEDLLAKNSVDSIQKEGDDYILIFKDPVSKSTIKTLFERQFQARLGDQYVAADVFDIVEIPGEAADEGRFKRLKLKIIKDANDGIKNLIAGKELEGDKGLLESAKREFSERPQPERLETFDGTLASETRTRALYAIIASWGAILLYLWFRFGNWTFGAAAVICLIHDLCFALGAIALCHFIHDTTVGQFLGLKDFKIDLPTVAALLTLVGYSVNDTIVVFDRIKEVRGKSALLTPQTINDSVNQTLSRTLLASLTVFLVVSVLYMFGGEGVHLFAFVMVIGVIVGTYSSIYIASPLLLIFGEGRVRGATAAPAPIPA